MTTSAVSHDCLQWTATRRELIALLWEDVDFENHSLRVWENITQRERGLPKSRKSRTVPMVDDVAGALKGLKARERYTQPKDPVFAGENGEPIDGSALRRRYIADLDRAGLRFLRFHDYADVGTTTTCATPSARWRSTAPRSCRSRRGWATPTSRRHCATCTTRAAPTTHGRSRAPSGPRARNSTKLPDRPCDRPRRCVLARPEQRAWARRARMTRVARM